MPDTPDAGDDAPSNEDRTAVAVFAPAPHLEISVELSADEDVELHVHPGGRATGSPA